MLSHYASLFWWQQINEKFEKKKKKFFLSELHLFGENSFMDCKIVSNEQAFWEFVY